MPPKIKDKAWISTTINEKLLEEFKILAVKQKKKLNQLLEEAIRDLLAKYSSNSKKDG